ncbi:NAD-dependent succinate-semialdehyde dehydrogenase [Micrococcus sp. TA1]|uniref:NAD-dependent succinate-semialdehyde dehydrogenase n=1 Tax=Micrococcus sp. TA1 TaxID=681627 RepID=UPI001620E7CC|nr:NAD-dependent succinate-semialdehyde dehydrogenase [Micrococcus sp. TA1]MBB5750576.1 succinate-semialdehyde dehydrogenase/glutarate-semialdehyde dehydrogenase [Micrococcus sp. TA1]
MSTTYETLDPSSNTVVARFDAAADDEVQAALEAAHGGYLRWRETPLGERVAILHRVAGIYRERAQELAELITLEMGKQIDQALGEIAVSADIFDYYAANAEQFLAPRRLPVDTGTAEVHLQPTGVLLGIMPWNYPHYQVARFAAPNLALGNTVLLKHAANCPQSALIIQDILRDAGLPRECYINLFATHDQLSTVIADPRVQGISLTGSERAGAIVAEQAGRHLKKVVLELGGSDPFIVLDDVRLEDTIEAAASRRLANAGQACTSPKRFIVVEEVYDRFVTGLKERFTDVRVGHPAQRDTGLGPVSSSAARDELVEQIEDAVAQGATLHVGGEARGEGFFLTPALLTDIPRQSRLWHEEAFGPVASVYKVADADAAVELANDSPYGLGAAVFGADPVQAQDVARRLDVGMVFINSNTESEPHLPFGGVKRSGYGRELGPLGIEEFANRKLIRVSDPLAG